MVADDRILAEVLDSVSEGVFVVDPDRRITHWNQGAERLTGYQRHEVVGSHCGTEVVLHLDCQGDLLCHKGCPMWLAMEQRRLQYVDAQVRHREGRTAAATVRALPLSDPAGAVIGAVGTFSTDPTLAGCLARIAELERLATHDPLTGLLNRRAVEASLTFRLDEMRRYGWPTGALFSDLDALKQANDVHGHGVGDSLLVLIARTLSEGARPFDVLGRWGGDEFVVVLTNVDEGQLWSVAQRLRELVEHSSLCIGTARVGVTISVGATLARLGDTAASLLERADGLLYRSKARGGNCVSMSR